MDDEERKKLDHKFQKKYGALFVCLGANIMAADEHKPKGAFAAPGLICCTITPAQFKRPCSETNEK